MNITLAHSGKQHSYQVAKALYDLGLLDKFYTSGYVKKNIQKISKNFPYNPLEKRYIDGLPSDKVNSNWRFELEEHWTRYILKNSIKARNSVYARDVNFDTYLSNRIGRLNTSHYWGFQGSCLQTLKKAKEFDKKTICELPSAHVMYGINILEEEAKLHPNWATAIDNIGYPKEYLDRLILEPEIADHVIVASSFSRKTLITQGIDESKILVLPLGFDKDRIPFSKNSVKQAKTGPLKVLFLGRVTAGKGIHYLMEAFKDLDKSEFELHLIGNTNNSKSQLNKFKYNYIEHGLLPQKILFDKLKDFDIMVLPSLFEGFGLVIIEAMAAGLPVITTPNTVGPDIIVNDTNGYLIPIRDSEAIKKTLIKVRNLSQEDLSTLKMNAHSSVIKYSWQNYQKRLSQILQKL